MRQFEKINNWQKVFFWTGVFVITLLCFFYGYYLNAAIRNVVARENTVEVISKLNSSIAEREFKYISLKNGISIDLAYSLGFKSAKDTAFVARKGISQEVSLNQKAGVR